MRNVFLALLWVWGEAAGPTRDGDWSREVEEYLRSMTKIKPQWSDEKILRSARGIYGDGWVPRRIPEYCRHVPGAVNSRPGSVLSRVEAMSSDEKRHAVFRILDRNPGANMGDIAKEFAAIFPMEPNPPSKFMVYKYIFFRNVDARVAELPSGYSWARLTNAERSRLNREGQRMLRERLAQGQDDNWEDIVYDVVVKINHAYNIKLKPSSVYKWYRDQRGLIGPPPGSSN